MKAKTSIVVTALMIAFTLGSCAAYQYGTMRTTDTLRVKGKDSVKHGEGQDKYLIDVGENAPVMQNSDAFLHGKFNSSTVYMNLEKGRCYQFEIYGWRVPFLSMYPNIISYAERKCK